MNVHKWSIKPFEVSQRSVKIKIYVNFYFDINFLNVQDGKTLTSAIKFERFAILQF